MPLFANFAPFAAKKHCGNTARNRGTARSLDFAHRIMYHFGMNCFAGKSLIVSRRLRRTTARITAVPHTLGRHVSTTDAGGTVYHAYDGIHCVADLDGDGSLLRAYTWGAGVDNLLAVTFYSTTATNTLYAVTDPLGTVLALVASDGTIAVSYTYDSWGNVLSVSGDQAVAAANRFTWQGREYSYATGLYNFRARWYDPAAGRWLSKDPIGLEGGLNLYEAFGNNPVCFGDYTGLWAIAIGGVGTAGASSGVSVGGGIVFGYSSSKGWLFGTYRTGSMGAHIGMDASFGVAITFAPGTKCVEDLSGPAISIGGSGGASLSFGGETTMPINGKFQGSSISFNVGVGIGVEGHVTTTYTDIITIVE